jgi:hypothetical protein
VTFFASQSGKTVLASFSQAVSSGWVIMPLPGTELVIENAEVQFSDDAIVTDTIVIQILGSVDVFAPQLSTAQGGTIPAGTAIPLRTTVYKTFSQMLDEAADAYPGIPPTGGSPRGTSHRTMFIGFPYRAVQPLLSSAGMFLRVSCKHDRVFQGTRSTCTFYAISRTGS